VRAIIALAHNLGMKVIAEGAETSSQVSILGELGCLHGQGYYFSHPVPPDVAEVMLAADPGPSAKDLMALQSGMAETRASLREVVPLAPS